MITKETLRAESSLSDLTDDQISVILKQVSDRIGEIHGAYDADFTNATGIEKPAGSGSSYKFWAAEMKKLKDKTASVSELEGKLAELQKKIKDGATDGEALKKLEEDNAGLIEQLKEAQAEKETMVSKFAEKENEIKSGKINAYFSGLAKELSYKDGLSDRVKSLAIKDAQQAVLNGSDVELSENGTPVLKRNGMVVNDNPADIFKAKMKDVLKEGRQAAGGGGTPPPPGAPPRGENQFETLKLALADAKTRVEASKIIRDTLVKEGVPVNDKKHGELTTKVWGEVVKPMELPRQ